MLFEQIHNKENAPDQKGSQREMLDQNKVAWK